MGKVYEALRKAEVEGHAAGWSSFAVEHTLTSASNGNGHKDDFIDYSLNALDGVEIEERNREIAAAQAERKSLTKPSREVTVDTARIAPPLTAFHTDAGEEYNRLAVTLIATAGERPLKRVLVASAQHGEGRTSITLNLACSLARAQRRVLVIDADLHRPSLLRFLGLSADAALSHALKN